MAKPTIKKDCKGTITAVSQSSEYVGQAQLKKQVCKEIPLKNILDTLTEKGFTALVDAIKFAELDCNCSSLETTFFAPTNEAFAMLGDGLKELTKDQVKDILLYHIVDEKLTSDELSNSLEVTTVNPVTIDLGFEINKNGKKFVLYNDDERAEIVETDIMATNGVIHVIDKVMLPTLLSIWDYVQRDENLSTLKVAIEQADLTETLDKPNALTLFAPNDAAFAELSKDDLEAVLNNPEALKNLLLYHVSAEVDADDLVSGQKIKVFNGGKVVVDVLEIPSEERMVSIDDAMILEQDIETTNGKIQIVSRVLNPDRNEIQPSETKSIDLDKDGDVDVKIKRIYNTSSYVIELLDEKEECLQRYVCGRIGRDGLDNNKINITELSTGEVRIDLNGDVYVCSLLVCSIDDEDEDDDTTTGGTGNDTITGNTTVTGGTGNDTGFGTVITPNDTITGSTVVGGAGNDTITTGTSGTGNDTITGNTTITGGTGNDTASGNSTLPGDTIPGNSDTIPAGSGNDSLTGQVCEEVIVTLNYAETVATLKALAKDITFSTEADFKAEINPTRVYRLPKRATIVRDDRVSQIVKEKNIAWKQFAGVANSMPLTIWRIPRTRKDKNGQSNVEYIISLLHEEGLIQIRIRAVET